MLPVRENSGGHPHIAIKWTHEESDILQVGLQNLEVRRALSEALDMTVQVHCWPSQVKAKGLDWPGWPDVKEGTAQINCSEELTISWDWGQQSMGVWDTWVVRCNHIVYCTKVLNKSLLTAIKFLYWHNWSVKELWYTTSQDFVPYKLQWWILWPIDLPCLR